MFGTHKRTYKMFMKTRFKIGLQLVIQPIFIGLGFFFYKILWPEWYIPIFIKFKNGVTTAPMRKSIDFPIIIDTGTIVTTTFYSIASSMFLLGEITSFILVYLILKALRKNVSSMSRETYRLYWQFTSLLLAQVIYAF